MEALAVTYPLSETEESVNLDLTHFSVTISQIDEMFAGFEFPPPSANVTNDTNDVPVSLSIPPSLYDDILLFQTPENESSIPRISNIVYNTEGLFLGVFAVYPLSVIATATLSVGSHIIQVSNLDPPIIINFKKLVSTPQVSCVFWNFDGKPEVYYILKPPPPLHLNCFLMITNS